MNSIIILYLISFVILIQNSSFNCQLNGKCGYPGKPYRAKLDPDNKLMYDEGEEVTYQCTDFWTFVQTRKCERGRWTGSQPRCGDFLQTNVLMKDSKLENITNEYKPILMWEHLDMEITNRSWKYPNAFTSNRFKKARLRVFDGHRYRWTFRFTESTVKLFVRMNFNFINHTFLTQEQKDNFTFDITLSVGSHRECELTHQSNEKWRDNGLKIDSNFICDSISYEAFKQDVREPGDYMSLTTKTNIDIPYDLIAIFFGKSYGTEEEPLCGEPEVSIAQISRFNVQFRDYSVVCKPEKYRYEAKYNETTRDIQFNGRKCGPDMKWTGTYPECTPAYPCSLDHLLKGSVSNKTVITSLDGLYFHNESLYYAIEGTEVNYGCSNPGADILVGKESRQCLKKGVWSGSEPYCYDPNESRKFPVWILIAILFSALVLIVCLTAILFYVYSKRIKSRITRQIADQTNRPESERFDGYDDIDIPGGKQLYDTYEPIGEESEVRYADPYYNINRDYVQMPTDVHMADDYWRIPEAEYLQMTGSGKPSPCPRRATKPEQTYTYEL